MGGVLSLNVFGGSYGSYVCSSSMGCVGYGFLFHYLLFPSIPLVSLSISYLFHSQSYFFRTNICFLINFFAQRLFPNLYFPYLFLLFSNSFFISSCVSSFLLFSNPYPSFSFLISLSLILCYFSFYFLIFPVLILFCLFWFIFCFIICISYY